MYKINDMPISDWGLRAGSIGSSLGGYALSGVWSLPKRLGDTHHDWQGGIEPYVLAGDINLDGRDLELALVCEAATAADLKAKTARFEAEIPSQFTLSHDTLGSFTVGLKETKTQLHATLWAELTLSLREPNPTLGTSLPTPDGGIFGLDGYSWAQLGFVVQTIDDRNGLTSWQALSITKDPRIDCWVAGFRQPKSITLKGTIKGADYADFQTKASRLQALLSKAGTRTVKYHDGSVFEAFCVDGFAMTVSKYNNIHMGDFVCKMIIL